MAQKKRKNPGVGVDFKRVKSKVGRKLKRVNETNTDFKTKSINLPSQNILRESGGEQRGKHDETVDIVLTRRMISMAQLIPQCRHYSPKVRIGAMQGILELLQSHEIHKTGSSLQQVLQCVLESLSDSNSRVRKLVLQVLGTFFKRHSSSNSNSRRNNGSNRSRGGSSSNRDGDGTNASGSQQGSLAPFVPLMLVHAFKTMTHLNHSVSLDGLDSLSAMLTELSGDISEQDDEFFRRLLQNFNAMLTQMFEESTNIESKSKFLAKLISCIEMALDMFRLRSKQNREGEDEDDAEYNNPSSSSSSSLGLDALRSSRNGGSDGISSCTRYAQNSLYEETWERMLHRKFPSEYENFMSAAGLDMETEKIKCQEVDMLANLRKLMGIFRVHLKDSKGGGGEQEAKDASVKEYFDITSRIVSCLFMLLSSYSDFNPEDVRSLMREMGNLFPLADGMSLMRKQKEDVLQFNMNCANLILACISYLQGAFDEREDYGLEDHHFTEIILETISSYTSHELNLFLKNGSKGATQLESKSLHSLVSAAVKALRLVKAEFRVQLMGDIHKILKKTKHFTVRKVVLRAICQRQNLFFEHCKEEDKLNWLLLIPKVIWEASKEKEKEVCELAASLLLKLLQCSKPIESAQKQSLQLQFLPLFGIPTEKGTIWGPYVSLGSNFQSNMTSLLHYVEPLTEKFVKSSAVCALHLGLSESSCAKLLEAVAFGARTNPSLQLSFFSSLVLKGCQEKSPRAKTIQRYICTSLKTSFSDYQGALLLLGKFVMSNVSSSSVSLLSALLLIFDGVVTSDDFGSEDFVKAFTEIVSTPLAYVLLMWAKSEVLQKQEDDFSCCLDDMWSMVEKASFLVPSLLRHFSAYMVDGNLSLPSKLVLLETNDKVIRSHVTSTILYEMVKHNLMKCNIVQVKDELKQCLNSIEMYNGSILGYGKYLYIKDNFS